MSNDLLRRDVRMLADMLGAIISRLAGPAALEMVEEIRLLARERRGGAREAEQQLADKIAAFDHDQARTVARAFSIFFDLANIAEDRQRVRVLREREARLDPQPIPETLAAGIAELKQAGFGPEAVQQALDNLSVELVFTAHPSEAKRRSIRAKLRRMRHSLEELDRDDLLPRERRRAEASLQAELSVLWQTEFLRPSRPTVLEEVERGLSIMPRVWEVVPLVYQSLELSLAEHYPGHAFQVPVFLRFGSWMGGDRDGNPHVTAEVTARTLCQLRNSAIDRHLLICKQMYDYLTISETAAAASWQLGQKVDEAIKQWPALAEALAGVAPHEAYRRWIKTVEWRLTQSRVSDIEWPAKPGDYGDGSGLVADVTAICECLAIDFGSLLSDSAARRWLDLTRTFGLHLTRLDIRQDARRYQEVLTEIFQALNVTENFAGLDDAGRTKVLVDTIDFAGDVQPERLSPLTVDTLRLYRVIQRAMVRFGASCLGANVISLTRSSSDVLGVLWLWRHAQASAEHTGKPRSKSELKIAPLFEKIGDLQRAGQTLESMLSNPLYAEYLAGQGNRQVVMVGYSDSTKDGGYLAACWGLQRAQSELHRVAAAHGVSLTFFHGRGGSLGRGGGPAARGILSLPSESFDGTLRLTEQGEVLAERYDDVQIAYRHLEQVTWATLVGATVRRQSPRPEWVELVEQLSQRSLAVYRDLVDQPGFMQFFAETTPIEEIENLPIGSRPARRRGERSLGDLRAIPWVFSWTQNRSIIPAWFGLGTALAEAKGHDPAAWSAIGEMYEHWPFFRATIENAVLALAKADMYIAQRYANLTGSSETRSVIWQRIAAEFQRTRGAILDLQGEPELLAATPWFQRSIEARNPYIDPLNLIQIEFMKRRRAQAAGEEDVAEEQRLRDLLRLTVQGIAAGMRTTG
ncbi:MAG TPA: phosphoenolpyruvate carboxylase [Pirellulales bacterium]|jgi:phosphoenolpyruvate carboxylase|nr:phosphoenolpyruvate carboxylase [Pirellulales bacterium]